MFKLHSKYQPTADQDRAIRALSQGITDDRPFQTLLGVTGSGKTFTMANVIANTNRPTLILAQNKTLAAQLAAEFRDYFPQNAVHYFVSYYDYYQPEAYIPRTDTYIEKDAAINEEIDRFRHAATVSLLTRRDVIIVASVSCIYGIGAPEDYKEIALHVQIGQHYPRQELLTRLTDMQFDRSGLDFKGGMYHVLGDVIEIFPANSNQVVRLEFFDDELEKISEVDPIDDHELSQLNEYILFPAKHNVTSADKITRAVPLIRQDLETRLQELQALGKIVEAERLRIKTEYDLEMLLEMGYTNGIENYSRYLSGRPAGSPPDTLFSFFPNDYLLFIDESHMTVPQLGAMYEGDRSRKQALIEYGFRLPSALDNRPLKFSEIEERLFRTIFVSATPGPYELKKCGPHVVEQIIRPTGILDPEISVRPTTHQIDDLLNEIQLVTAARERVLITTLTKKSAEHLTTYLQEHGVRVRYLHSDVETVERIALLRDLRLGEFDVLVGINLLREGLDLPEVGLVAILDADKQGFLRSQTALLQTIGRAARNVHGRVIMYADRETAAMQATIAITQERRAKQQAYNEAHDITPRTIVSSIKDLGFTRKQPKDAALDGKLSTKEKTKLIAQLELEMDFFAANLEFEKAAAIRDRIARLK